MADDFGVWAHAVARGLGPEQLAGITGVGGNPVRTVESAGLVAVVSPVDLGEFGAEPLRRNLEDLAWLEVIARAHHDVVDAVTHLAPVAPIRLATVYRDDAGLAEVLAQRRDDFIAALDRVAGRTEWGVKAYAVPGAVAAAGSAAGGGEGGGGPGAAYLRRRRAQLSAREEGQQAALNGADEVHTALARYAEAAQRHAPQDPRLSGEKGSMVLNGAYLVDGQRAGEFADAVNALADRHPAVRLRMTGPWPPYSFAAVDVADHEVPAVDGEEPSG